MGGYQLSYEAFETFVQKQAIMAKADRAKAGEVKFSQDGALFSAFKSGNYVGSAEGREEAVFELANYLGAPEKEVKRIWLEAEE